jgi:LAO/AO transport system kinase
MRPARFDPVTLAAAIFKGDRAALARAITLVESTRADHRDAAERLLAAILPRSGGALRLGVSGAPGVGKSTFIEAFGLRLIAAGHRVAVLAVDPSSKRAGGSILGDKTRMTELARAEQAFIRPSPAGISLGGVARRTRDAMLLAEAAGFDVVLVETVGVGQSETAVADMVDLFLLLIAPGGGDELQGIKKGIVELADLVIVNKDDGDLAPAARRAVADYRHALRLLVPADDADRVDVLAVSAVEDKGLDRVWQIAQQRLDAARVDGRFMARRRAQAVAALWREIGDGLMDLFRADDGAGRMLRGLESKVSAGSITPSAAARQALATFVRDQR